MKSHPSRPRPLWPYFLLVGLAWLALFFTAPARAATNCGSLADVLAGLRSTFGEEVLLQGADIDGRQFVLTANPDGSTWSILTRSPDATACIVLAGANWSAGDPVAPPADEEG